MATAEPSHWVCHYLSLLRQGCTWGRLSASPGLWQRAIPRGPVNPVQDPPTFDAPAQYHLAPRLLGLLNRLILWPVAQGLGLLLKDGNHNRLCSCCTRRLTEKLNWDQWNTKMQLLRELFHWSAPHQWTWGQQKESRPLPFDYTICLSESGVSYTHTHTHIHTSLTNVSDHCLSFNVIMITVSEYVHCIGVWVISSTNISSKWTGMYTCTWLCQQHTYIHDV